MHEFDKYCKDRNISMADTPVAFAAWLNFISGWDGDSDPVCS